VGKPKEREILLASGKLYQQQDYIYSQEKTTYNTQTVPPNFCLENVPSSVLLYDPPRKQHLKNCATICCYDLFCTTPSTTKTLKLPRFPCAFLAFKNRALLLLYRLYGSVQYDLPHNNKLQQLQNRVLPWEMHPLASLSSPPQSSLENLSISSSHCLAHYPMHSLIIRK
jgi:hypothetical protein